MIRGLGITEIQLGLAFSAFSWVYALCMVPASIACEVAGPRRAMTVLVASWGAVTLLTGLIPGTSVAPELLVVAVLVGVRALMGVVQAALFPAIQGPVLIRWLPPGRWALASSLTNVGLTLGGAAAGPLVAWLVLAVGWRQSFALTAPIGFALAAAWSWYFRDDPAHHPRVNAEELAVIGRRHAGAARADWRLGLGRVFANRESVLLTVSYALVGYLSGFFYNWFYYYLVEVRHISAGLAGTLTGALWLVGSVSAVTGGVLCDWLCARRGVRSGCRLIGLIGGLPIAPLLVLGAHASRPATIVTLLALAFGLTQFTDAVYWVAAMRVAGPRAAAATGLMNSGTAAATGIGSLAIPIIALHLGWYQAVTSGALFALASAVCWLWIAADRTIAEPVPVPVLVQPSPSITVG
jgi:ACS family glucarate transporter-like MFS transporter